MAYTKTTKKTEFSGNYKVVCYTVTPDAATGSVDVSGELGTVVGVQATFIGDATANCYTISTSISGTTVTVKLWKAGGTAADTAYVSFHLLVIGY